MPDKKNNLRLLMVTELFLPTKGGTAVSFDDDFRRLGGKDVHIVTADVPAGAYVIGNPARLAEHPVAEEAGNE